jgi:hypothetical protein
LEKDIIKNDHKDSEIGNWENAGTKTNRTKGNGNRAI